MVPATFRLKRVVYKGDSHNSHSEHKVTQGVGIVSPFNKSTDRGEETRQTDLNKGCAVRYLVIYLVLILLLWCYLSPITSLFSKENWPSYVLSWIVNTRKSASTDYFYLILFWISSTYMNGLNSCEFSGKIEIQYGKFVDLSPAVFSQGFPQNNSWFTELVK